VYIKVSDFPMVKANLVFISTNDLCNPPAPPSVLYTVDENKELFWTFLEAEHPRAEAFCRRLAGNRADGDDLYQDSLLAALRKFDRLRDHKSFRPWLYRIMINTFVSARRSPWRRKRTELTTEILETLSSGDPGAQYAARRWLEIAMRALNPADRALVTLYELDGWSIPELSELLGKPTGTIKSRLSRARARMRGTISKYLTNDVQTEKVKYALPQSES
jgi:RNA polymerase sigma-70 factor (ECF subfamily)